jgi:imidazolonepropionase-like amidohydrolase
MTTWHIKFIFLLLGSIQAGVSASAGTGDTPARDLLIRNTTLISPERSQPLTGATILVRNGNIARVSARPFTTGDSTPVVDGTGLYLVPGLMDSHLHTSVIPGLGFQGGKRSRAFAAMTELYQRQFERSLLYFGITQVLDPAPHPEALARFRSRELAPDLFHCGAAPIANGYPTIFIDPETVADILPYRIYESVPGAPPIAGVDPSRHTPEAVVERMRADGAICLKLFFEDGWDNQSGWPMLSDDATARVIRAAHAAGLKVIAHANALDMQQLAVEAGVDVLGHGLWNWNQHGRESGLPDGIRRHLDRVHAAGIGYQPTLRVMDGIQELFLPEKLNDPALVKVVPAALLDWYRTEPAQAFKHELAHEDFDDLSDAEIANLTRHPISRGERSLKYLSGIGHPLLLASDHPAHPGHANHPGLSSYQEIVHLAKLGIGLPRIFAAATINNAETFGLADRYGSVEVGKVANLLLLEADPLQTVEAYDRIRWIVLGGRLIARETLSAEFVR